MIKRLTDKGVLTYEKQGRVFVYAPLVGEQEYVSQESHSFLERFYNSSLTAMVTAYLDDDSLSSQEIDSLRTLLAENSRKGGS